MPTVSKQPTLNVHTTRKKTLINEPGKTKVNYIVIITAIMFLATTIGMSMVIEFGINIYLSNWIQHPLRSAWINFSIGTLCLLPLFILCNKNTSKQYNIESSNIKKQNTVKDIFHYLISSLKSDKKNYIVFFNGLCGVIIVTAPIYILPLIGFAFYTISVIFGQIIASMLMDNYGLFWTLTKKLTPVNLIGSIMAICGIIIYQIPSFPNKDNNTNGTDNIGLIILYMIIAMFAGVIVTIQSALNRRLQYIIQGTSYQSAFLSFLNSIIILTIINIILYIIKEDWFETNEKYFEFYMFFGGLTGAFIVSMVIICPTYIGFVATYTCIIFGSLIMSIIFDYFNAFGIDVNQEVHKSIERIIGVTVVFIGAILVNISSKNEYKLANDNEEEDSSYNIIKIPSKSPNDNSDCELFE